MGREFDDLADRKASNWREYLSGNKQSINTIRWLWNEFFSERTKRWAKMFFCIIVVQVIIEMLLPLPVRYLVDGIVAKNRSMVLWSVVAYAILQIIPRFIHYLELFVRNRITFENTACLDLGLNKLFFEKSLGQHMQESGMLSSAGMEKGRARALIVQDLIFNDAVRAICGISIAYIFLWFLSPFAGIVVSVLFLSTICWSLYLNRHVLLTCLPIDREYRAYNRYRVERWDHIDRVKTNGKENDEIEHMDSWYTKFLQKERSFWSWYDVMKTIRGLINSLGVIAIAVYATYYIFTGAWSIGILFPLLNWSSYIKDNLWQLGYIENQLNFHLPALCALKDALSLKPDIVCKQNASALRSDDDIRVELNNVSHAYPLRGAHEDNFGEGNDRMILKHVSFTIEPGEKVALMGESGAGKTSIMRLITRSADPTAGAILVNGKDLRDIDLTSWLSSIGYIAQQPQVFDGTIMYNLMYAVPHALRAGISEEDVWSLMKKLKIDFGKRLTDGLHTIVGRNGIKLSGGQSQRLMIGAAAIKKPRFMIIDEATSSLDSTTEKEVQRGLASVLDDNTSALIITHRLSTVRDLCSKFVLLRSADRLHNGDNQVEAVASSFEELYELSPTFRRLADDQGIVMAS